jgi:membrane protein implicated in regulation of membrane protease activity
MGSGPPAISPSATGIPRNTLDDYFKSIREPFRETREGMAKDDGPSGVLILIFTFCLIPLIPYLAHKLLVWLFGSMLISFYFVHLDLYSFWLLWIGLFLVSLSLMILVAKVSAPSKEEKNKWLTQRQMRFAYCYGVVDEIRNYRTNRIDRHIESAIEYLQRARASLIPGSPLALAEPMYAAALHGDRVTIRRDKDSRPKWYRLQPETELTMRAFDELVPKLRDRIKDKKDLQTVESILTALAVYYYTEIPELSSDQPDSNFEHVGEQSLLSFANQVTGLSPYHSEEEPLTPKEKVSQKILLILHRLSLSFVHENVLIAFFAWYTLMLLLFYAGFYVAFRFVPLMKTDTTVVTAIVGGPISAAVAAVAIPRIGKLKK